MVGELKGKESALPHNGESRPYPMISRLLAVLLALSVSACDMSSRDANGKSRQIPVPEKTDDGWDVASLGSVGMERGSDYIFPSLNR